MAAIYKNMITQEFWGKGSEQVYKVYVWIWLPLAGGDLVYRKNEKEGTDGHQEKSNPGSTFFFFFRFPPVLAVMQAREGRFMA